MYCRAWQRTCSTHVLNAQQPIVCMYLVRAKSVLNISLVCLLQFIAIPGKHRWTDMCTQAKMMGKKALEAAQVRALTVLSGLVDCTPSIICCLLQSETALRLSVLAMARQSRLSQHIAFSELTHVWQLSQHGLMHASFENLLLHLAVHTVNAHCAGLCR